jgi:regulator of vacuolar morphogenesis
MIDVACVIPESCLSCPNRTQHLMAAIQSVRVLGHEERSEPKNHVVYKIEVRASVRSWLMWRRYSEFDDLHTELTKNTGTPPPHPLPPKHTLALFRSKEDPKLIQERIDGLETYLRAIVSSKDDRWRESYEFKQFLGIPTSKRDGVEGGAPTTFTSASWIDEQMDVLNIVRDIRTDLNRRDTYLEAGDTSSAHEINVQAKKKLVMVLNRLDNLTNGLNALARSGMSEGEVQRRMVMTGQLQDDCEKLSKMMVFSRAGPSRTFAGGGRGVTGSRVPASEEERNGLFGEATGSSSGKPTFARVFGAQAAPQETEQTRPLDDQGVLLLQQDKMKDQDSHAEQLTTILMRQHQMSLAINRELMEQNELLDGLGEEVDRVGGKLDKARKQLGRLG